MSVPSVEKCKESFYRAFQPFYSDDASLYKIVSSRFPLSSALHSPRNFYAAVLLTGLAFGDLLLLVLRSLKKETHTTAVQNPLKDQSTNPLKDQLTFLEFHQSLPQTKCTVMLDSAVQNPLKDQSTFLGFHQSLPQTKCTVMLDSYDISLNPEEMENCIEAGEKNDLLFIAFRMSITNIDDDFTSKGAFIIQQTANKADWGFRSIGLGSESGELYFYPRIATLFGKDEDSEDLRDLVQDLINDYYSNKPLKTHLTKSSWTEYALDKP